MAATNRNTILIMTNDDRDSDVYRQIFQLHDDEEGRLATSTKQEDSVARLKDADLYFTTEVDEELASQCNIWFGSPSLMMPILASRVPSRLEWIQSTSAGVDPFLKLDNATINNFILTNMRGIFGTQIAEYAVGHILNYCLKLPQHYKSNSSSKSDIIEGKKRWNNNSRPQQFRGSNVAILGVGSIGSEVARLCQAMGCRTVWGYTRSSEECTFIDSYVHSREEALSCMTPEIDYWINVMPHTPDTQNFFNKDLFTKMKKGAVLINAGSGSAIYDADLLEALDQKIVAYAVLDVFQEEPLPCDHIYWKHPSVLVTSHTAAITDPNAAARVFCDNYDRWCRDESSLQYQVDLRRGY